MKRIAALLLASAVIVGLLASPLMAAKPAETGFDEFGYNDNARLFNGWYGYYDRVIDGGWVVGTADAWLVMKWSKDWVPMIDEPEGAWCTNHWTWYANSYDVSTWYGWLGRAAWTEKEVLPDADYRIEEFMKIMKVGDDPEAWSMYEAGGAYSAGWGSYSSGVPKYVVFQDTVEVYDVDTGEMVFSVDLCTGSPKGLGQPIF